MNYKICIVIVGFLNLILTNSALSQTLSNVVVIESGMPLNNIGIIGKEVPKGEIKGSQYLFDDWVVANVLINDDKLLKDIKMNVDLMRNEVDILIGENRKVLPKSIVSNFQLVESNLMYYWQSVDEDLILICELVEGNSFDLLEEVFLTIKEPTYNVALDMGSRDTEILRRTNFWIRHKNGTLTKISNSGRKNLKAFKDDSLLKDFINDNQLSWKSRNDLILITQKANAEL